MRTFVAKCDKCGKDCSEGKTWEDRLWLVQINTAPVGEHGLSYHPQHSGISADWCQECLTKAGIGTHVIAAPEGTKLPTMEDLIKAIVKNELDNS